MNWLARLMTGVTPAVHAHGIQVALPSPASVAGAREGGFPPTAVSQDDLVAIDGGRKQASADDPSISTSESGSRTIPPSRNAPMVVLALGRLNDRKGYTAVIRAFALAGRLGDRLTLIGYGRHRRRLERWAKALGIDAVVTFHEPNRASEIDLMGVDVVIFVSHDPQCQSPLILSALASDMAIIATHEDEKTTKASKDRKPVILVDGHDVLALSSAIARVRLAALPSKTC